MIMVKHDQIQGLLGDLPFATIEIGAYERIDHLDQRGGPDNRVELVAHQRIERLKGVAKKTVGTCQPEVSFSLMVAPLLGPRLIAAMIMVPGQHEEISGIVRHHSMEFNGDRFDVLKRH